MTQTKDGLTEKADTSNHNLIGGHMKYLKNNRGEAVVAFLVGMVFTMVASAYAADGLKKEIKQYEKHAIERTVDK